VWVVPGHTGFGAAKAAVTVSTTSGPVVTGSGVAADGQSGVVVDDVEDLDVAVTGQAPVDDVALPALVGQVGLEAFPG
jgi:hypothetical protein